MVLVWSPVRRASGGAPAGLRFRRLTGVLMLLALAVPPIVPTGASAGESCVTFLLGLPETADAGDCANDAKNAGVEGTRCAAAVEGPDVARVATGGNGYTDGSVVLWTPLFVVNSPYHGSATRTAGTTIETSFDFGVLFTLSSSEVNWQSVAVTAEDGVSAGYYVKAEWSHYPRVKSACGKTTQTEHWAITDYSPNPSNTVETFPGILTGPSQQTDADNILVPSNAPLDGVQVMKIDARFKQADLLECGALGVRWEHATGQSRQYKAAVSFEWNLGGTSVAVVGGSEARTTFGSYTFQSEGALCYAVDWLDDAGGAAFAYNGPSPTVNPRVVASSWAPGTPSGDDSNRGCDALDIVEAVKGPRQTNLYHHYVEATDVDHGRLTFKYDHSKPMVVTDQGDFERVVVDSLGRTVTFSYTFDWTTWTIDTGTAVRVDYEYDESVAGIRLPVKVYIPNQADASGSNPDWLDLVLWSSQEGSVLNAEFVASSLPLEEIQTTQAQITGAMLKVALGDLARALVKVFVGDVPGGPSITANCLAADLNAPPKDLQSWTGASQTGYFERAGP